MYRPVLLLLFALPLVAEAVDTKVSGFVGVELRGFVSDARFADQLNGFQPSLVIQPEFEAETGNDEGQISVIPFARLDSRDDRRTHIDFREAYWSRVEKEWEVLAGINQVFWGVTESHHLVDIINQIDFVEDVDNEDKLGQPMLNLATERDWGALSLFVMPWFRERTFPEKRGRLRFPLVVDHDVEYESDAGQHHVDVAVRYSHFIDEWDLGLHYFRGTGREPRLVPNRQGTRFIAHYDQIDQVGADVQYTHEAWLWKFEGIVRNQHGDHFGAMVGGFEYTLYQIINTPADLGLLLEYQYDRRDKDPAKAPQTMFDDDVFIGARLALNDVRDSELLIGVAVDREDGSSLLSMEVERRLDNHSTLELESRWFLNVDESNSLSAFKDDSFVAVRFTRYF